MEGAKKAKAHCEMYIAQYRQTALTRLFNLSLKTQRGSPSYHGLVGQLRQYLDSLEDEFRPPAAATRAPPSAAVGAPPAAEEERGDEPADQPAPGQSDPAQQDKPVADAPVQRPVQQLKRRSKEVRRRIERGSPRALKREQEQYPAGIYQHPETEKVLRERPRGCPLPDEVVLGGPSQSRGAGRSSENDLVAAPCLTSLQMMCHRRKEESSVWKSTLSIWRCGRRKAS